MWPFRRTLARFCGVPASNTHPEEFQKWCGKNGVTQSMGKAGVCWDNAVAENFFSHLKTDFYHHERFGSRFVARTAVTDYIEGWYN
jgi:putative transposase